MSIVGSNVLAGASGQSRGIKIERSLRFNSIDSAFLSRQPSTAGNRKIFTLSFWWKNTVRSTGLQRPIFVAQEASPRKEYWTKLVTTDGNILSFASRSGGADIFSLVTTQVFRDPSAWYHIVLQADTTQATASNRLRLYVNGTQVTTFSTATYPSPSLDIAYINESGASHFLGRYLDNTYEYLDSYLADIWFVDSQALTPSAFGEFDTNNVWQPKAYSGSYSGNSFHLDFADNSAATAAALGKDTSGNSNNWTPNNLSVTAGAGNDSLVDSPTNYGTDTGAGGEVRGNYATLNPLAKGTTQVLANGNLDVLAPSGHGTTNATIAVTAGLKAYMEFTRTGGTEGGGWGFTSNLTPYSGYPGNASNLWWVYDNGGNFVYENNGTTTQYASKTTNGQILQLAIDYDAGKAWIGINNTWFTAANATTGNPSTGANPTLTFSTTLPLFPLVEAAGWTVACNFGQRPFAYTAPSGFKALCTANLPTPTIAKGSDYMDVKLYTGNGSTQTISGLNFSPDFVWLKSRSSGSYSHNIYDIVRGATKIIYSDSTSAENTDASGLTAFNSDGFSLGSTAATNASSTTYVGWCWDAGAPLSAVSFTSTANSNPR